MNTMTWLKTRLRNWLLEDVELKAKNFDGVPKASPTPKLEAEGQVVTKPIATADPMAEEKSYSRHLEEATERLKADVSVESSPATSGDPGEIFNEMVSLGFSEESTLEQIQGKYEKYCSTRTEMPDVEAARDEAIYLYMRYRRGDKSAFEQLHALVEKMGHARVRMVLAMAYRDFSDYSSAATQYERCVLDAPDAIHKVSAVVGLQECLINNGDASGAIEALTSVLETLAPDSEPAVKVLRTLADAYETVGEQDLKAVALEGVIESDPKDVTVRVNSAYAYSHKEGIESLMALYHYKQVLKTSPDDKAALNNLGVQYEKLKLSTLAVDNYTRAKNLGSAVAYANLANLLMNAGFHESAGKLLEEVGAKATQHAFVGTTISKYSNIRNNESKQETSFIKTAGDHQNFFRRFGKSYFFKAKGSSVSLSGNWTAGSIEAEVVETGASIELKFTDVTSYRLNGKRANGGVLLDTETKELWVSDYQKQSHKSFAFVEGSELRVLVGSGRTAKLWTFTRKVDTVAHPTIA